MSYPTAIIQIVAISIVTIKKISAVVDVLEVFMKYVMREYLNECEQENAVQRYIPPFKRDSGRESKKCHSPVNSQDDTQNSPENISYYRTSSGFSQAIRNLIDLFKHQRARKYQFAVLYLSPEERLSVENMSFRTRQGTVSTPDEATDRNSRIFPPGGKLFNYLTARPDGQDHAEALLMDRFNSLMRCYSIHESKPICKTILLFTWILPCDDCKQKILEKLKRFLKQQQVILVYMIKGEKDEDQEGATISELKSAGVTVKKGRTYSIQPAIDNWMT